MEDFLAITRCTDLELARGIVEGTYDLSSAISRYYEMGGSSEPSPSTASNSSSSAAAVTATAGAGSRAPMATAGAGSSRADTAGRAAAAAAPTYVAGSRAGTATTAGAGRAAAGAGSAPAPASPPPGPASGLSSAVKRPRDAVLRISLVKEQPPFKPGEGGLASTSRDHNEARVRLILAAVQLAPILEQFAPEVIIAQLEESDPRDDATGRAPIHVIPLDRAGGALRVKIPLRAATSLKTFLEPSVPLRHCCYALGLHLYGQSPAAQSFADTAVRWWEEQFGNSAPRSVRALITAGVLPEDWATAWSERSAQWWPPAAGSRHAVADWPRAKTLRTEAKAAAQAEVATTVEGQRAQRAAAAEARMRAQAAEEK